MSRFTFIEKRLTSDLEEVKEAHLASDRATRIKNAMIGGGEMKLTLAKRARTAAECVPVHHKLTNQGGILILTGEESAELEALIRRAVDRVGVESMATLNRITRREDG